MPAERLVKLPDAIGYDDAASVMLQGLTAHYLLRRTYPVKAGDTILIHAAAGGVGLLVCQWAKALGATVIGTVGSDEKAALASAHGCDHPIVYTRENFTQRVKEITNGAGVPVVYDSIGKDTYIGSLDCLAPLGYFVSFGNASGPLPPIDSKEFSSRGSLFFTRPTLFSYIAKRADLEAAAAELFDVILSGKVKTSINQRYPLAEVGRARRPRSRARPPARPSSCRDAAPACRRCAGTQRGDAGGGQRAAAGASSIPSLPRAGHLAAAARPLAARRVYAFLYRPDHL
jgi:NADPH2:quinone reductase